MQPKRLLIMLSLVIAASFAHGVQILENTFQKASDFESWSKSKYAKIVPGEGLVITTDKDLPPTASCGAAYRFNARECAGKRLTFFYEVKRNLRQPITKWQGGKFMVTIKTPNKSDWPGTYMKPGNIPWEKKTLIVDVPVDAELVELFLGIQAAQGSIAFRNLTVDKGDAVIRLDKVANMHFVDKVAGDGKGGWSDQGSGNDAAKFRYREKVYGNVPFSVIEPEKNNGKAALVMKSPRFANGVEHAALDISQGDISGKYLYLLHTLTWGHGVKSPVGKIVVIGKNGKRHNLTIMPEADVADWWTPSTKANAFPAAVWSNSSGGTVGLYLSRFAIPADMGSVGKIEFSATNAGPVWIICGVTLSNTNYPTPAEKHVVISEGERWKRPARPSLIGVLPGSALDISWIAASGKTGDHGRLIINKNGSFAFANQPEKAVRFNASTLVTDPFGGRGKNKADFVSKEKIAEFADLMLRSGYNMARIHYVDAIMLARSTKDFEFNPRALDQFDYMVYCFKQRGIYLNLDAMASKIGYSHGYSWELKPGDKRNFKLDMHFNPAVRENWYKGVDKLLNHVNPYTNTKLLDDPILTMFVGFNEQEFAVGWNGCYEQGIKQWRDFLRSRYGTIYKLKKAWGENAAKDITSFDEIKIFNDQQLHRATPLGNDIARFFTKIENDTYNFYRDSLRKMGFKGSIANYNMGQSLRYVIVRDDSDFVALNGYHAHPFGDAVNPEGSVKAMARVMRGYSSTRGYRKPFAITEHGHAFWNRMRYEQGFVTGGYSAFQNFDVLTSFATPVAVFNDEHPVSVFMVKSDPVTRASEFLTALMFLRRDVKSAPNTVRLMVEPESIFRSNSANDALNTEQSALALVTGMTVEVANANKKLQKNESALLATGGSAVIFEAAVENAGSTRAVESVGGMFSFNCEIAKLKHQNLLPKNNRSDFGAGLFESSTGELMLDSEKEFFSINTPRLQGICAKAGGKVTLPDFEVKDMTTRGNLAAISIDGVAPLRSAKRLVVTYITNAFNSGMVFSDESCRVRLKPGSIPVLLETGSFSVTLKNTNSAKMKCYAIGLDGARLMELPLNKMSDNTLSLQVDTAKQKCGPTFYFELIAE